MIELLKVKIHLDTRYVELEYHEIVTPPGSLQPRKTKHTTEHEYCYHPDLEKAFDALIVHACLLADVIDEDTFDFANPSDRERDLLEKFKVTGIIFSKPGTEDYGVTISYRRYLRSKKIQNNLVPYTRFEEREGVDNYAYLHLLLECCQKVIKEGEEYLAGKFVDTPQLELFEEL